MQPDTIVPDLSNPQSWNRYSYVMNRPVVASDPTGNYCVGDVEECVAHDDADEGGTGDGYQPPDPGNEHSGGSCDTNNNGVSDIVCPDQDNTREFWDVQRANAYDATCPAGTPLVECYYAHGSLFMGDETLYISAAEFNELMLAIYYEVNGRNSIDLSVTSINFDTPFYDLSRTGTALPGRACIDGLGCYSRTEINYVAQGIIAAGAGQSREGGLEKVIAWKLASAQHLPSQGTVSMYDVGYNFYHIQNGSMPPPFSPLILIPISVSVQQTTNP